MKSYRDWKKKKKTPDTTSLITTPQITRLRKVCFYARITEAAKGIASKIQPVAALEIVYKNREKMKKLQTFDLRYYI